MVRRALPILVVLLLTAGLVVLLVLRAGRHQSGSPGLSEIDALAVDPLHPRTVYATDTWDPVYKSTDGGASWKRLGPSKGGGVFGGVVLDPGRPKTVYAGTQGGVFKSIDGGASWMRSGLKETLTALALAPDGRVLYAGAACFSYLPCGPGVFRSTDAGASWVPSGLDGQDVVALALDPRRPTTIYAATDEPSFKSTDGGASWQLLDGLPSGVNTLAVDPRHPTVVYAGTAAGVFKSVDGGVVWHDLGLHVVPTRPTQFASGPESNSGVDDFAFGPKTVYSATDSGVFGSTDGGKTWRVVGAEGSIVPAVAVSASGRVLYAGTGTGGVYRFRLGG